MPHAAAHDLLDATLVGDAARALRALTAGADPNARVLHGDWAGFPPLVIATLLGHTSVVSALLAQGADPDATTPRGNTALMVASGLGLVDVAVLLLAGGADAGARDPQGRAAHELVDAERAPELAEALRDALADSRGGGVRPKGPDEDSAVRRLARGVRRPARWASERVAGARSALTQVADSLAAGVAHGAGLAQGASRARARRGSPREAWEQAAQAAGARPGAVVRYEGPPTHRLRVAWEHVQPAVSELAVGRWREEEHEGLVALSGDTGQVTYLTVEGALRAAFPLPAPAEHLAVTGDRGHGLLLAAATGFRGRAVVYDVAGTVVARLPKRLLPAGLAWTAPRSEAEPSPTSDAWPHVSLLCTSPLRRAAAFRPEGLPRWETPGGVGGRAITAVPTAPPPPAVTERLSSTFNPASDALGSAVAAVALMAGGVALVVGGGTPLRVLGRERLERLVTLGPERGHGPAAGSIRWPRVVGVTVAPRRWRRGRAAVASGGDGPHLVALDGAGHALWRAPCAPASPLAVGWVWAGEAREATRDDPVAPAEDVLDDEPGWEPWLAYVDRGGDVVVLDPRARRRALLSPSEGGLERPTALAWLVGTTEGDPTLRSFLALGHEGGVTACEITPLDG